MRRTFMALGSHGRLGNQLWQLASTMGLALKDNCGIGFPAWRYQPYFNVPASFFECRPQPGDVDPGLVHMQELQYLDNDIELYRDAFSQSDLMSAQLEEKYPWFFELEAPVAVHVRRGDALGREQWHPIQPQSYYEAAVRKIKDEIPNADILVFSDGIRWCLENMAPDYHYVSPEWINDDTVENAVDHEEFFLMQACRAHVIANSTLSWWAAYTADTEAVIYPLQWFGPSYPELQATFQDKFIPEGWLGL